MRYGLIVLLAWSLSGFAAETPGTSPALPNPLTLESALAMVRSRHPDLEAARADILREQAQALADISDAGVQSSLALRPQWVRPVESLSGESGWVDDAWGSVSLSKRLTDFGRTTSLREKAEKRVEAATAALAARAGQRELDVMRLFYAVLIADMQAQRDQENMALHYVKLDKLRNRGKLGEVSDVDLLKAESEYQAVRMDYYRSEADQSTTRARLAAALNLPGKLPSDLETPTLKNLDAPAPTYQKVLTHLLTNNDMLKRGQLLVEAAEKALAASRKQLNPSLSADVDAYAWNRRLSRRNDVVAGLRLDLPLYQGGRVKAAVGKAEAALTQARVDKRKVELALYETAMELSGRLSSLRAERESLRTLLDYRDAYLARSRAQYEMEEKTDLGDAMVKLSDAQLKALKVDAALAVAWKELEVLGGGKLPEQEVVRNETND